MNRDIETIPLETFLSPCTWLRQLMRRRRARAVPPAEAHEQHRVGRQRAVLLLPGVQVRGREHEAAAAAAVGRLAGHVKEHACDTKVRPSRCGSKEGCSIISDVTFRRENIGLIVSNSMEYAMSYEGLIKRRTLPLGGIEHAPRTYGAPGG